jgi:hypothetical protein
LFLAVFLLAFVPILSGQSRIYTLGTSVDVAGGGTNFLGGTAVVQTPDQSFVSYYSLNPTLMLKVNGAHSSINTTYSYGIDRSTDSQDSFNHQSHAGSLNFSSALSPAWNISLSDSFRSSSDISSFNAIRGVASDPVSPLVFNPVADQVITRSNSAGLSVGYRATERSSLAFTVSHSLTNFQNATGVAASALSNQQSFGGDMSYSYKSGKHENWTVGYNGSYSRFTGFDNAYSQSVRTGYSNEIMPGLTIAVSVGVSDVQSQGSAGRDINYNSSASLQKTLRHNNSFAVSFSQYTGQSGLGSISSTRSSSLAFSQSAKHVYFFLNVSVFDTQGTLDNSFSARGGTATASIGLPLSPSWSVRGGAEYQRTVDISAFGFTQKRAFFGIRYSKPSLWRTAK